MKDEMGRPERDWEEREKNPGEFKGRCKGGMHKTKAAWLENITIVEMFIIKYANQFQKVIVICLEYVKV